jgi:hypothetical protein
MNYKTQIICIWVGLLGGVFIGIGQYSLMHYMPPISSALSAIEIADYYRVHHVAMLAGAIFVELGYAGVLVLCAPLAVLIMKMESPGRTWTYLWLMSTAIAYMASFLTWAIWSTAAFRVDRSPEIILALNDFAGIAYVGLVAPALPQFGSLGFAILGDRSPKRIFPRWIGYFNIWVALGSMPSAFIAFFPHGGPFSWNGVIGFWIAVGIYFIWVPVTVWSTIKTLKRLQREEEPAFA